MLCMFGIIVHLNDLQNNDIYMVLSLIYLFLVFKVNLHIQVGRQFHILNSNSWVNKYK